MVMAPDDASRADTMASASATPPLRATDPAGIHLYWRVAGVTLAALAGVGILLVAIGRGGMLEGVMAFDTAHNLLHVLLAIVSLALGFGDVQTSLAKGAAKGAGILYLALALLGFASADLLGLGGLLGLRFDWGENVLHLLLGAWGAYVGFRR